MTRQRYLDACGGAAVSAWPMITPRSGRIKAQVDTSCLCLQGPLTNQPAEDLAKFLIDRAEGRFQAA